MFFYSFKASSRSSFISFSKRNRKLLVAKSSTRISKKIWIMTLDLCIFIWKLLQMSYLSFYHFGIFYQFLSDFMDFIIDLSGNTVWPQDSGFQKFAKLTIFGIFCWTFVNSNCKRCSFRLQCWIRLFLWFSNTVLLFEQSERSEISKSFFCFAS